MKKQQDLSAQAKQALDDSAQKLPEHIQTQLAQARAQAVLAAKHKTPVTDFTRLSKQWVALAACVSLIVPIWLGVSSYSSNNSTQTQDFDLMVSLAEMDAEEWELVDDLEFALWLSEQAGQDDKIKSS